MSDFGEQMSFHLFKDKIINPICFNHLFFLFDKKNWEFSNLKEMREYFNNFPKHISSLQDYYRFNKETIEDF